MNTPDRIWADGDATGSKKHADWDWDSGCWGHQQERDGEMEYIRADLVQSLIQAAHDIDRQYCDNDLGPSALAMGKLREAYMRLK